MKTIAVITEYNPFHNGHLHQLEEIRRRFGPKTKIVILMSGNFVQRGEPAVLSRESRTRIALKAGASLVLEIPLAFATASARDFADGAVRLLSQTGICSDIACGAENPESAELFALAEYLDAENSPYQAKLREYLSEGKNYASAREAAVLALNPAKAESWRPYFREANNILALEYAQAILRENRRRSGRPLTLTLLPRKGNDRSRSLPEASSGIPASATAIRRLMDKVTERSARLLALEPYLPDFSLAELLAEPTVSASTLLPTYLRSLLGRTSDELLDYRYMEPGLADRLLKTVTQTATSGRPSDLAKTQTRYYPTTRINRALLSWLLGIRQADWEQIQADGPCFIRVAGYDKDGRYLLRLMRKLASLPRVDKNSDLLETPGSDLPSARLQQQLALQGDRLYRLLGDPAAEAVPIFDSHREIQ